jgi:serine protease Do
MSSSKSKLMAVAGFILIGVAIGMIFASNFNWTPNSFASKKSESVVLGNQEAVSDAILNLQNTSKAFTAVSKEILPTVVSIATSKIIKRSSEENDFWGPIFKDFFGRDFQQRMPESQRLQGLGSGVIVSHDGYILTNNHVIQDADDIKVTLYDKREFEAKLIGADPLTEVAVIKIDGEDLPVARLGDSGKIEVGEWVLAVGNPLYLTSTVTAGIVSAKGRAIGIIQDEKAQQTGGSYAIENFIQTDAAINPGNSGGALVNLKAEVIGINTAIATRTGGYQGYGFAIPINLAKKIMVDLIDKGYVTRAWLGIAMRPVNERVVERYHMDRPKGVIIEQVMDDSPAKKAGLKPLDIILKINDEDVFQSNEVQNTIALKNPGDIVKLTILRDGKEKEIRVKLGQKDTGKEGSPTQEDDQVASLGLTIQNLTDEIRSHYNAYKDAEGVIVTQVESFSAAAEAGIQRGDLIVKIEDEPVTSVSSYRKTLRKYKKGEVIIFSLKRGDVDLHAFVKLPD